MPAQRQVVRASAIFETMMQLALAMEGLLEDDSKLVVVRAKDRLNNPTSFGYADFLLNVRLSEGPHSGHVGELQVRARRLHTSTHVLARVGLRFDPSCTLTSSISRPSTTSSRLIETRYVQTAQERRQSGTITS